MFYFFPLSSGYTSQIWAYLHLAHSLGFFLFSTRLIFRFPSWPTNKMSSLRCVQRLRYAVVRTPQLNIARGLRAVDRNRKGIDELLNKFDEVDGLPPAKGPKGRLQKALEAVKVTALPAAAQGQLDAFGEELTDLLNEAIESKVGCSTFPNFILPVLDLPFPVMFILSLLFIMHQKTIRLFRF